MKSNAPGVTFLFYYFSESVYTNSFLKKLNRNRLR